MVYQDNNLKYTNAEAYDKRGENSIIEKYVLGLWQPFLKKIIGNFSHNKIVVDLGCGTGEYTQAAKSAKKIYAVDVSSEMLKICREKLIDFNQAEIILSDIQNFKMAEPADLVITIGVWEYINPDDLFNKVKEITRHGSKAIVVFPNIYNDLNCMRSVARIKRAALRPGYIRKLFIKDFYLVESASFGNVFWAPKKLQFLTLPVWEFSDWLWKPFQKRLPLGVNVYYLFERK
ncbi:MAG: class I SAM-dependent methyltransferase [Patescibacteria group bacterium]